MMRKISWMFLCVLVFSVYAEDSVGSTSANENAAIAYALIVVGGLLSIYSVYLCVKHNRSWAIGIPIGITKVLFSCLSILMVMSAIACYVESKGKSVKDGRTATGFRTEGEKPIWAWVAGAIVVLLGFMAKWLINGERVYEEKGWNISSTAASVTESG